MTKWLSCMDELMERYPREYLALVDDEIISSGISEFEAYKKAKDKCPGKKISLV